MNNVETNLDEDIYGQLNKELYPLEEVDFEYMQSIVEDDELGKLMEYNNKYSFAIYYVLKDKDYINFIIMVRRKEEDAAYLEIEAIEVNSWESTSSKKPIFSFVDNYLSASIKFDGTFNLKMGNEGIIQMDGCDIAKHFCLMSNIYSLAKLHIKNFMGINCVW